MIRRTYILIPLSLFTIFTFAFQKSGFHTRNTTNNEKAESLMLIDTTVEIIASICAGDTLEGYFETGIYLDTFVGSDGTDSIRVLDLTVEDPIMVFFSSTLCAGDTLEGYFESGMFIDTFLSVSDCDSIRVLNLTVQDSIETLLLAEICAGDTLEGFFESGIFTETFTAVSGCDSIRTLELTVLDSIETLVTAQICTGESMAGYTTTGIFVDTFTTDLGCDSIRTLDLTVLDFTIYELEMTICEGDTFEGHFLSGVFSDTFDISGGCDSIRILRLNIFPCDPVVYYDLEACRSYMIDGSNMDYSEFVPAYPGTLGCAPLSAGIVHRQNPQVWKHSCTPGVNDSIAMCVSSLTTCTYSAGHDASIVIEFTMNQQGQFYSQFTGLEFYERAPVNYVWIDGPTGAQ